jgi:hypothetical protein
MDRIVSICLGIFIVILVAFTGIIAYSGYMETAYRNTVTGTYTYSCTVTTDAPLYNVTLFIPVPADTGGNSPMVAGFSSRAVKGVPADWDTTLFDTGKATMIRITTPAIVPPEGTTASDPYAITLSSETTSRTPIDTRNPVEKSAMFRPVQALSASTCPQGLPEGTPRCFAYTTSVYAEYSTAADTRVTINSTVTGKNSWTIFEPLSNEYHTGIDVVLQGANHGWVVPSGILTSGIGTYENPAGS